MRAQQLQRELQPAAVQCRRQRFVHYAAGAVSVDGPPPSPTRVVMLFAHSKRNQVRGNWAALKLSRSEVFCVSKPLSLDCRLSNEDGAMDQQKNFAERLF